MTDYMAARWRVLVVNQENSPSEELATALDDAGLRGMIPRYLPKALLVLEGDPTFLLLPPAAPSFAEVMGHVADLHNASLPAETE